MAEQIITIKLKWENGSHFLMTETVGATTKDIVKSEENGDIASIWPSITKVCTSFVASKMAVIGTEMAQP